MANSAAAVRGCDAGARAFDREPQAVIIAAEDERLEVDPLLAGRGEVGDLLPVQPVVVTEAHRDRPAVGDDALHGGLAGDVDVAAGETQDEHAGIARVGDANTGARGGEVLNRERAGRQRRQ